MHFSRYSNETMHPHINSKVLSHPLLICKVFFSVGTVGAFAPKVLRNLIITHRICTHGPQVYLKADFRDLSCYLHPCSSNPNDDPDLDMTIKQLEKSFGDSMVKIIITKILKISF